MPVEFIGVFYRIKGAPDGDDLLCKACTDGGLSVVKKEEFSITCYRCEKPSIFIRDKLIFSSERMLHKDYYRKISV
jgi:hypothetical protein